jgi:FkbM family methyltransferase
LVLKDVPVADCNLLGSIKAEKAMRFLSFAVKKLAARIWPALATRLPWNCEPSYSQFGEDMVINWLIRCRARPGIYVDIGAFHPIRLSNTFALYCKGWRGINIEARPGVVKEFNLYRPRDVNLELCITPYPASSVEFFLFEDAALNTMDPAQAEMCTSQGHRLLEKRSVPASTLAPVLERHLPKGTELDLLTIDVEGMDEAILRSFDWSRFIPTMLIVERAGVLFRDLPNDPLVQFLEGLGYDLVAKCAVSLIFRQTRVWRERYFDQGNPPIAILRPEATPV